MEVSETYLAVRWSTSRGRDTYGYNICSVTDQVTRKRYSCNGGGYDMLGTSIGDWLQETYQAELVAIKDQAHAIYTETTEGPWDRQVNEKGLYGMTYNATRDHVTLDGACGLSSIEAIAKAIGVKLSAGRQNTTTGYIVTARETDQS